MFLNISSHPSEKWSPEQATAARELGGEIGDVKFPVVPSAADEAQIASLADELATQVADDGDVAMVSGEFTLTYATVRRLRARGVRVVAATTDRKSVETTKADGSVEKTAIFVFVRFRDFE